MAVKLYPIAGDPAPITLTPGFAVKLVLTIGTFVGAYGAFAADNYFRIGVAVAPNGTETNQFTEAQYASWNGSAFFGPLVRRDVRGGEVLGDINVGGISVNFEKVSAIGATDVTITPTLGGDPNYLYAVALIGGDDVAVTIKTETSPSSNTTQQISSLCRGATPSFYLLIGGRTGNSANGAHLALGVCDGTAAGQGVTAFQQFGSTVGNAGTPNAVHSYQPSSSPKVMAFLDDVTGAVLAEATHVSVAAGVINLDWVSTVAQDYKVVAVSGVPAKVGRILQPLTAQTVRTTDLGVVPELVWLQSAGMVASDAVQTDLRFSVGLTDLVQQHGVWNGDNTGIGALANRRNLRYKSDASCLIHAHPTGVSSGAIDAAAAALGAGSTAGGYYDLGFTQSDGVQRETIFLALGGLPSTITREQAWRARQGDGLVANVRLYHRDAAGVAKQFTVAQLALAAKNDYLDGRVLELDDIERALSERGYLEGSSVNVVVADTDSEFRGFFGNANQRVLYNVEVAIEVQSIDDWLAGKTPIIAFRGNVTLYKALGGFKFSLTCEDWLSLRTGKRVALPRIGDAFPGAPTEALDRYGDVWYGRNSDGGSQTGVSPTPADEPAFGSSALTLTLGAAGFGALGITAPTGLAMAEFGAGNFKTGNVLYGMVVGRKASRGAAGYRSDPNPFLPNGAPITISSDDVGIQMTCVPDGSDDYEFWLAASFAGNVLYKQRIVTTDPTTGVVFTQAPGAGTIDIADETNVTPGAEGPDWNRIYNYVMLARFADGLTAITSYWNHTSTPFRRPVRVVAVPSAGPVLEYLLLRRGGDWDHQWTIPTTSINGDGNIVFDDSQLDDSPLLVRINGAPSPKGIVPGTVVGDVLDANGVTRLGVAFAAHACDEIEDLFFVAADTVTRIGDSRFGSEYFAPDKPNFSTHFPSAGYHDAGDGTRWTLAYVSGADAAALLDGSATLYANLQGAESVGDRTGVFLDQVPDQIAHFLDNYGLANDADIYDGGLWGTIPRWADGSPRRDAASFTAALVDMAAAGLPATGAWGVQGGDKPPRVIDALAGPLNSFDLAYGPSPEGAYRLVLEDPLDAPVSDVIYDADLDFDEDSDEWEDDVDESAFFNVETVQASPRYSAGGIESFAEEVTTRDTTVTDDYGEREAEPAVVQLPAVRSAYVASLVGRRRVDRARHPPRTMTARTGLQALLQEVGQVAEVTSRQGPGPNGYIAQQMRLRRIVTSFATGKVQLTLRELVTASFAGFNLEDFMAEFPLGGSLEFSPTIASTPQTVDPYDPPGAPVKVPWSILPNSADVRMVGRAFIESGVTSIKVQVWDVAAAVMVHETAALTTTSLPASNALNVDVPITKPGTSDKEYEMKAVVTGGVGLAVFFKTKIRVTV